MMQSCASPAKLRGSGPILHSGLEAMVYRRVTATSDSSADRTTGCQTCVVLFLFLGCSRRRP